MIKELKALSILAATGLLVACGAGDATSGKETVVLDENAPIVESISPNIILSKGGRTEISTSTKDITFTFNEALDPDSVTALNTVSVERKSGQLLKGTWAYDQTTFKLTFTFDFSSLSADANKLPLDETFILRFSIKDIAGNELVQYEAEFSTAQTYDIQVTTNGLPAESSIDIIISDQSGEIQDIDFNISASGNKTAETAFAADTRFLLSIAKQPDAETFCSFSNASGEIGSGDFNVKLNCSNVVPYETSTANWNSYYWPDTTKPFIHGGEQRKFTLSALNGCENLVINDDLGAFDWSCKIDDTDPASPKTVIYSTNLKSGRYLSDLLDFNRTNPAWLKNSVSVTKNGTELNDPQVPAIWWNNPVMIPKNKSLSTKGAIYLITGENDYADDSLSRSYSINAEQIALIIQPGNTLITPSELAAIKISSNFAWLEGKVDASGSTTGLTIGNNYYNQIRNFEISNAKEDGIRLSSSMRTYFVDVISRENGANGLSISGASITGTIFGNITQNVRLDDNLGYGLRAKTGYNLLASVHAYNNKLDGISLSINNHLSNSDAGNNAGNGLSLNGHNNTVTMFTSDSNAEAGILFSQQTPDVSPLPRNNFVSSVTLTNNTDGNITLFGDADVDNSNTIINALRDGETVSQNALPSTMLNHVFFDGTDAGITTSYLKNAVEPFGDNSGNDNGLCEAGEKCLFTVNTGHYQGQGQLEIVEDTDKVWSSDPPTADDITLERYPQNGG